MHYAWLVHRTWASSTPRFHQPLHAQVAAGKHEMLVVVWKFELKLHQRGHWVHHTQTLVPLMDRLGGTPNDYSVMQLVSVQ